MSSSNRTISSMANRREVLPPGILPTSYDLAQPVQGSLTISALDGAMADIFRGLAKEEIELLVSFGRPVKCHPGQIVVQVGDCSGEMFVILEGSLREITPTNGTKSEAPAVYLCGDVVGASPFVAAGVHKRSMIAMEESRLLGLSVETLNDLVLTMPRLAAKIFRNVAAIVAARFQQEITLSGTALIPASMLLLGAICREQI